VAEESQRASESREEHPVGAYAALMAAFVTAAGGFAGWMARSQREFPERFDARDLALMTVATHKASRLVAKDRVTQAVRAPFTSFQQGSGAGEVEERARGRGLRRAIGELLICPYCLGMWIATVFAAGMTLAPRQTRWAASVLTAHFGADVLQIAYKKLENTL
jgi:Flp pilus assembly protein TadB